MKFVFMLTALLLFSQVAVAGDIGFAWLAIYDLSKVYFIPMFLVQFPVFAFKSFKCRNGCCSYFNFCNKFNFLFVYGIYNKKNY